MGARNSNRDRDRSRSGGRISFQTLVIASVASAAASFAASRIWGAGTLVSAAATPVVVALVSESLRRPVQTVAATAKKVPTVYTFPALKHTTGAPQDTTQVQETPGRGTPDQATPGEPQSGPQQRQSGGQVEPPTDSAAVTGGPPIDLDEPNHVRRNWLLAVGTGLLAFAIIVAFYTVPDLVAGRSITGNGQSTTFFGGSAKVTRTATSSTTVTTTTPTTTLTRTASTTTTTKTTTSTTPTSTSSTSTATSTTPRTASTTTAPGAVSTTTSTTPAP